MQQIIQSLATFLAERHGEAVTVFDVRERSSVTDAMILVSARNTVHLRALEDAVSEWIAQHSAESDAEGFDPHPRVSGTPDSGWVVVDGHVAVVHLVTPEMRDWYELDALFEKRATQILHF